jgi:hypothetical protein
MPWPTYSRTTEKPFALTCFSTVPHTSNSRLPGPHPIDGQFERFLGHPQQLPVASLTSPIGTVMAESP